MERLLAASHERKASVFATMKNPAVTATFQARTRECIEGFVEFVERTRANLESGPLTPALSPSEGEREHRQPPVAKTGAVGRFEKRTAPSPLPCRGGEGQGERATVAPQISPHRPPLQSWTESFLSEIGYVDEIRRSE